MAIFCFSVNVLPSSLLRIRRSPPHTLYLSLGAKDFATNGLQIANRLGNLSLVEIRFYQVLLTYESDCPSLHQMQFIVPCSLSIIIITKNFLKIKFLLIPTAHFLLGNLVIISLDCRIHTTAFDIFDFSFICYNYYTKNFFKNQKEI